MNRIARRISRFLALSLVAAVALLVGGVVAAGQIPTIRDPKLNASLNPIFNASINPKFNAGINPEYNASLNPKFNPSMICL